MLAKFWIAALCIAAGAAFGEDYGLGRTASSEEIADWNIDIAPDGAGLPPGQGTVAQGANLRGQMCGLSRRARRGQADGCVGR